jgi:hypothetical protein
MPDEIDRMIDWWLTQGVREFERAARKLLRAGLAPEPRARNRRTAPRPRPPATVKKTEKPSIEAKAIWAAMVLVRGSTTVKTAHAVLTDLEARKTAYREACRKYHPDRATDGLIQMQEVNEANSYLGKTIYPYSEG